MKEIKNYDFVTLDDTGRYYFVSAINNDVATIVGMKLTECGDSIMFYAKLVNMNKLKFVDESFININGPLAILRDNMKSGIGDDYIEDFTA